MKKLLIINGPNLNLLGKREELYGGKSLEEISLYTQEKLANENVELEWWQSNHEGEIIEKIQSLVESDFHGLVINPAGYSHTSVAILDALKIITIPIAEVHLTNVYRRESFRQQMLTAQASSIIMSGLGIDAYYYGALALIRES